MKVYLPVCLPTTLVSFGVEEGTAPWSGLRLDDPNPWGRPERSPSLWDPFREWHTEYRSEYLPYGRRESTGVSRQPSVPTRSSTFYYRFNSLVHGHVYMWKYHQVKPVCTKMNLFVVCTYKSVYMYSDILGCSLKGWSDFYTKWSGFTLRYQCKMFLL